MFSKACEYGIKSMIFIARQSDREGRVSLKEIAHAIDSPVAFTAKILQILSRDGLLQSLKGPTGGFVLGGLAEKITLAQIVTSIDGDSIYRGCGLGLEECNEVKPCPLHFQFKEVRDRLKAMLENTSLRELAEGMKKGITFLKH